jgi:osomolarity two-component system sensor histidine kinase NIK1
LYTLINGVLDFSRIEAQKIVIDKGQFNLRESLYELMEMMISKAQHKNLRLELDVASGVPEFVEGDRYWLGQVLTNLMENAIKFSDEGGVKVTVQSQPRCLEFTVSDTGIGIPEDKLETIFETFTQGDGSSTRRYSGTGLGLSIAKRLVELMGGRISVHSRPGHGSEFTFTLPVKSTEDVS